MPDKKIKILHVSPDGKLYGTERHILAVVKHSDKERFEHYVATPERGNFNDALDRIGIKYFIAGRKHGYKSKLESITAEGSRELYRIIRKEKFDVIHSHLNSFGGIIGRIAGADSVVHTRHGVFWSEEELKNISAKDKYFQKIKSGIFDLSIAIGEYEKNTMIGKFDYNENKIRVTVNGVDTDELNSGVNTSLTKNDLFGSDELIIGTVGRLERQKGFEILIEAVSKIKDSIIKNNVKFVIIGDGSCREELTDLRDKFGLSDKIKFFEYKENIPDYVHNFDIYVSTSLWEGMSYSVQEAMALGKPVIALTSENVSGLKELIIDGESGILIEDNYTDNLAENLMKLIEDKNMRTYLGENARTREKNLFQEWRTAEDMDKVYQELFDSKNSVKQL